MLIVVIDSDCPLEPALSNSPPDSRCLTARTPTSLSPLTPCPSLLAKQCGRGTRWKPRRRRRWTFTQSTRTRWWDRGQCAPTTSPVGPTAPSATAPSLPLSSRSSLSLSEKIFGYEGLKIKVQNCNARPAQHAQCVPRPKLTIPPPLSLPLPSLSLPTHPPRPQHPQLCYGAGSLLTLLCKTAAEVVDPEEGAAPDKPLASIKEWLPAGCISSQEKFCNELEAAEAAFAPPGDMLTSYTRDDARFEVYAVRCRPGPRLWLCVPGAASSLTNSTPPFPLPQSATDTPNLRAYHERAQTFAIWYIEAANFIDLDDENWRILHV